MIPVSDTLLAGIGVSFAVEYLRSLLPWPEVASVKLTLTLVVSAGAEALVGLQRGRAAVLTVVAIAGVASVTHRVHRLLGALGDIHQAQVLSMGLRGRKRI